MDAGSKSTSGTGQVEGFHGDGMVDWDHEVLDYVDVDHSPRQAFLW